MDSSPLSPAAEPPRQLLLAEPDVQAILLVRAVEESDPEGQLLGLGERLRATEHGRDAGSFEGFLRARSSALASLIEEQHAFLRRLRRAARLALGIGPVALLAAVLGLASNLLGPEKRINVVANSLAALILWNLAIYALLAAAALRARLGPGAVAGPGLAARCVGWLTTLHARRSGPRGAHAPGAAAARSFLERWNPCAARLLGARASRVLHAGAFAMVAGALAGMYARGLLFEYRATWESTFLDASAVGGWLGALLGPATLLSGIDLPGLASIEAPADGDAAPWIHLYALTTVLAVLAPRCLLAASAGARSRRLARGLELETSDAYYRRLWAQRSGREESASVLPYSYTLTPPRAEHLKALLFDVLGSRARIHVEETLPYGESVEGALCPVGGVAAGSEPEGELRRVLLFNLAQTPESEVHGRLARGLTPGDEGGTCVALVDHAAWRERAATWSASTLERRLAERSRTWDRVLREAGLEAVHVDLDQPPPADLLERVERAWRPRSEVSP